MFELAGKIAVVTGAGRGLGRAVAVALASRKAAVALVARHQDQLDETARLIRAAGGTAQVLPVDISQVDAVAVLRAESKRSSGRRRF